MSTEFQTTNSLVQERIATLEAITTEQLENATEFLEALQEAIDVDPEYVDEPVSQIYVPTVIPITGTEPIDRGETISALIDECCDDEIVPPVVDSSGVDAISVDIGDPPDLEAVAPVTDFGTVPDPLNINPPDEQTIGDVPIPEMNPYTTPPPPSFDVIVIPPPPPLDVGTFDAPVPNPTFLDPENTFSWEEDLYASELNDAVKAQLLSWVQNGGTGLAEEVEDDIWDRQSERDEVAMSENVDEAKTAFSATGFTLPGGALVGMIDEILDKHKNVLTDKARDIAIEQANLAQKNTHFATDSSLKYEAMMIQHASNVADRSLKAAMGVMEFSIAIYNALVTRYNVDVALYAARGQVYEAQIRGELAKAEMYKAQIEGVKVEVDIQNALVDRYKAQLDAVNILVNIYRTEMEGANVRAAVERTRMEGYKAQVDAFTAQVQAKTAEYGGYKAQIDGETAKVAAYSEEVKAYAAEVDAYSSKAKAIESEVNAQVGIERVKAEYVGHDITKYRAQIDALLGGMRGHIDMYEADTARYSEDIKKAAEEARMYIEQARIQEMNALNNIRSALSASQMNLEAFIKVSEMKIEGNRGGSEIYANLVSNAMNAINAQMSISSGFVDQYSLDTRKHYSHSATYPDEYTGVQTL
jgi:hypothetical protein